MKDKKTTSEKERVMAPCTTQIEKVIDVWWRCSGCSRCWKAPDSILVETVRCPNDVMKED